MSENKPAQDQYEEILADTDGKYLTFYTNNQLFGIPIADVVQIVGMQSITEIPEFPAYAKGIINLRGIIIPVIDMRLRLSKPEATYDERTCIIVTNISGCHVGFIVDAVDEVADIDPTAVSAPPKMSRSTEESYLTGIARQDDNVVLLLDTDKILNEDVSEFLCRSDIAELNEGASSHV